MRVLGIESSSTTASIAIIDDDKLVCEYTINNTMKHSKTLMPMLEDVLNRLEININTVDLVAVSEGPGSFTGLRIGSATAKGIAQGLNIKIASIPTLEVLASTIMVRDVVVGVVLYARAREVYYGEYKTTLVDGEIYTKEITTIEALEVDELANRLKIKEYDTDFYLVGDGTERFNEMFININSRLIILPQIFCSFSAKNVALLGLKRYYNGDVIKYYEQKPYYHKKSQAEREYEERNK